MRPRIAISLAVLFVAGMLAARPASAQQPAKPRAIVSKVFPRYPELARSMRLEGAVKLEIIVAPQGAVKSMRAVGGSPLLLKAAADAVTQWKWAPASQDTTEIVELKFRPE
jgi:TonB family protein